MRMRHPANAPPSSLRRFGITEGNRQTMSLGMTMSQLTNPERHMPWPDLWESQSPQGERLEEYAVRELSGKPHVGNAAGDHRGCRAACGGSGAGSRTGSAMGNPQSGRIRAVVRRYGRHPAHDAGVRA
ncbi:hypothetical protein LJK88_16975 [Paenibacillus sp. P26]|nr:hypothetical protein LJK88_16975 [Paenibacillus sp. P26]